jgi:hypothetical protein
MFQTSSSFQLLWHHFFFHSKAIKSLQDSKSLLPFKYLQGGMLPWNVCPLLFKNSQIAVFAQPATNQQKKRK